MDKKIGFLNSFNKVVAYAEDRDIIDEVGALRATSDLDIECYQVISEGVTIWDSESLDEAIEYSKAADYEVFIVAVES